MINALQRVLDLVAPRQCAICGGRLAVGERLVCLACNMQLPRTDHLAHPYDNEMAKAFWGRVKHVEKAAAMIYYQAGSKAAYPIYNLKYHHRAGAGTVLGQMMGAEMRQAGFLDDVDLLVPVPLTKGRQRERGYNQSEMIARGMGQVCGKPVRTDILVRKDFGASQTTMDRWARNANVEHAFELVGGDKIENCHVLLVDDIVTTGATMCACANQLERAKGVRTSMAAIGFVDTRR